VKVPLQTHVNIILFEDFKDQMLHSFPTKCRTLEELKKEELKEEELKTKKKHC